METRDDKGDTSLSGKEGESESLTFPGLAMEVEFCGIIWGGGGSVGTYLVLLLKDVSMDGLVMQILARHTRMIFEQASALTSAPVAVTFDQCKPPIGIRSINKQKPNHRRQFNWLSPILHA